LHIASATGVDVEEGQTVHGIIDWYQRYNRMKHHTASHVLFSSIRKVLGLEKLVYKGVEIGDEKARIDISLGKSISHSQIMEIERLSNKVCLENRMVKSWFTTREEVESTYGKELGITEVTPSGIVRVVEVKGWDVALCCGTHVNCTAEIGLIKVLGRFRLQKGVERIEFAAGEHAYKHYEKAMQILSDLAQMLGTSTGKLMEHVNLLLSEKEVLKDEIEKTRSQLVKSNVIELMRQAETFGRFRFLRREMKDVDVQSLKSIATTLANMDAWLIAILGSRTIDKAFIVGAAGSKAVESGFDMRDITGEAAKILGGGGGTARVAQAGGRNVRLFEDALSICSQKVLTH